MTTKVSPSQTPVFQPQPSPLPDIVGLGGAVAGLGAGLAMAVVAALISLSVGDDIWLESKQIAALVLGQTALQPGFVAGPVLLGTLMHFMISAFLGALFGIVTRRMFRLPSDFGAPVVGGLIYGFTIWLLAYFVVLPIVNHYLLETYAPAFIIQHLVYGGVLGLLYTRLRPEPYDADDPWFRIDG